MAFSWRIGNSTSQRQRKALFESWVDAHAPDLFALAYRLCGDRELAEELVQEAFFQAWKGMDRLREPDRARAWLMTILRHCYSRAMRERVQQRAVRAALAAGDAPGQAYGGPGTPSAPGTAGADPATNLAERDALQQALDRLDERYKAVFLLVNVGGLTCEAAAAELNIPLGTVLSRLHRARRQLREWLEAPHPALDSASHPGSGGTGPTLRLGGEAS